MNRLFVNEISKSFLHRNKSFQIIQSISLHVYEKEIVGIIGPSGCGKTTLFNIIAGLIPSDSGEIRIDDRIITSVHGTCGYMFQDSLLFPWMKSVENIMLSFEINGVDKKEAEAKARHLLDTFHLLAYADYYPDQLSGGMKQRIALLRTVAFNSNLLLLDEPFGSLDAITRTDLHLYLLRMWKKLNLSILFSTHDIREALFLADRIYVLGKQPTVIVEEIKVDLPHPRIPTDLLSKKASIIEKRLLQMLHLSASGKNSNPAS